MAHIEYLHIVREDCPRLTGLPQSPPERNGSRPDAPEGGHRPKAFAALRHAPFRTHLPTSMLAMMGDNMEHIITYWAMFQVFRSPLLGWLRGDQPLAPGSAVLGLYAGVARGSFRLPAR